MLQGGGVTESTHKLTKNPTGKKQITRLTEIVILIRVISGDKCAHIAA